MISYILRSIICDEFEKNIGRMQWQRHLNGEPMYAMQMDFKLHERDYRDNLYPHAQLLIFSASSAPGVYVRESKSRDEFEPWRHLSEHDSCWRYDGVERFIKHYQDRMATLGFHGGMFGSNEWYDRVEISEEMYQQLRNITKETREGKRPRAFS